MAKLSHIKRQPTERILLYSPPGFGKTHLIGELATAGYTLHYFDFENGKKTLFELPIEAQENINYYRIPDTSHVPKAGKFLLAFAKLGGKVTFCETHGDILCPACKRAGIPLVEFDMSAMTSKDVVVFESLNKVQLSVMNNLFKDSKREPDAKAEWEDFRRQGQIVESILSFFEQCNTNIIFTSHPLDVYKDDKYECTVPIGGSSTVSQNTNKYFDHCVYIRMEGSKRVLYSQNNKIPKLRVKSRYNIDLSTTQPPSLLPIFNHVMAFDNSPGREVEAVYSENATKLAPLAEAAVTEQAKPALSLGTAGQGKIGVTSILGNLKTLGGK